MGRSSSALVDCRRKVQPSEEAVAWLLLLIAFPRVVSNPFGEMLPQVREAAVNQFVTLLLDTFGYFALYQAISVSHEVVWRRRLLTAPLVFYWALNVTYSASQIFRTVVLHLKATEMSDPFAYAFAAAKVIAVMTFVPAVLAPYEAFAKARWPKRLLIFLHVELAD